MITPADWSLPAASFLAPVLGSDQSACPAGQHYILIDRFPCPTNGVHFTTGFQLGKIMHMNENFHSAQFIFAAVIFACAAIVGITKGRLPSIRGGVAKKKDGAIIFGLCIALYICISIFLFATAFLWRGK